jgi:nitric oxide reductase NorD protein
MLQKALKDKQKNDTASDSDPDVLLARFADALAPLIDRFGYDGIEAIGHFMAAIGQSDPKSADYLLKKSPTIIEDLLVHGEKQVINVYTQAYRILPHGSIAALRLIEKSGAIMALSDYETLKNTTTLACDVAGTNLATAVALIETSPAILEKTGFKGLEKVAQYAIAIAQSSWIYSVKALENSPAIIAQLAEIGGKPYSYTVYDLGAQMAKNDYNYALRLVEQSPIIAKKLAASGNSALFCDLYQQAGQTVFFGSILTYALIEAAPGLIERLSPTGYESVKRVASVLATEDPQKAITLTANSIQTIDNLLARFEPDQVVDIYNIGYELANTNAQLGLKFILVADQLAAHNDIEKFFIVSTMAQKIAAISHAAAKAYLGVASALFTRIEIDALLKLVDEVIPIAVKSWETASRLFVKSPDLIDRVGLSGLMTVAEFAAFLAPKDHSAAVLLLDKACRILDELKKIDGVELLPDIFNFGRKMARLNARLAVSIIDCSPQIINQTGFAGLEKMEVLAGQAGQKSWTAAVALVQTAPAIVKRVGYDGLKQITAVACNVAEKNSYGAVSLLEKSPALIDVLKEYEDHALALTVYAVAADIAPVSWRLATAFLEKSPALFQLVGSEGILTLSELLLKAARVSGLVATRILALSPVVIEQMEIDGLASLCTTAKLIAANDVDGAIKYLEKSPLTMQQIQESGGKAVVALVFSLAADIALISPAVATRFVEKSPGFLDLVGFQGLGMIVTFISAAARKDPKKALGYLSGDTPAFTDFMDTIPKGLDLSAVKPILSIYLKALLGRRVEITSAKSDYTDGTKIYLPDRIRDFEDDSDNFSAYKVLATHLEAHLEYGSFEFDIRNIEDLVNKIEAHYGTKTPEAENDIERLAEHFPEPDLMRDLFNLMEDFRIESILKSEYPALGHEIERMHHYKLKRRRSPQKISNPKQRTVEAIGQSLLADKILTFECKKTMAIVSEAKSLAKTLTVSTTDVHDTAKTAFALYLAIDQSFDQAYRPVKPMSKPLDQDIVSNNIGSFGKASQHIKNQLQKGQAATSHKPPAPVEAKSNLEYETQPTHDRPDQKNLQKGPSRDSRNQRSFEGARGGGKQKSGDAGHKTEDASPANADMKFDSTEKIERLLRAVHRERGITPKEITRRIEGLHQNALDLFLHHLERSLKKKTQLTSEPGTHLYPEWGEDIDDYRSDWAKVHEQVLRGQSLDFYRETLDKHAGLLKKIRREFQMLKPEGFVKKKRQYDGDDIDLDAMVEYLIDRKAGLAPFENNYYLTQKKKRDIAVAFLVDMSKSTKGGTIEREKEALVLMSEALNEVGDSFAVYGFSGDNRDNVDFYHVKNFDERYDNNIKKRICAISNRFENRDGTAIRHTIHKLKKQPERTRIIILLSDGKPVDKEYSGTYAMEDTRMALKEAQHCGIKTFCITVDKDAADYLPRMYRHSSWVVIDDVVKLPEKITRIYRRLTT